MSRTSDARWNVDTVHGFASRWQHHSKLGSQSCARARLSTYALSSGNKDACRCFHDSELYNTASVLHKKESDSEMERA